MPKHPTATMAENRTIEYCSEGGQVIKFTAIFHEARLQLFMIDHTLTIVTVALNVINANAEAGYEKFGRSDGANNPANFMEEPLPELWSYS